MKYTIAKEQVKQYQKNGFLCPLDLLSPEELNYYQQQWAKLKEALPAGQNIVRSPSIFINLSWAYKLATHPKILDVVESIIGKNILINGGLILSKPADASSFVSWHQDANYMTYLNNSEALTCWLALSESNVKNGCMRVLPETQNQKLKHIEVYDDKNMLSLGQTVEDVDNDKAIDLELKPGQMSLHHINILHSSNLNLSDALRTGFIVRYCTPEISQKNGTILFYARGEKAYPHLNLITTPPAYPIEEGILRQIENDTAVAERYKKMRLK